jgi:hypothetical protein
MPGRTAVPDPPPPLTAAALDPPTATIVGDIETFLQAALATLAPEPVPRGPGRPRILPATCLWAGLLVSLVRGLPRQAAVFRLLTQTGLWDYPRFPLSDSALYARLARAPVAPLQTLFAHVLQLLSARLTPYQDLALAPFASAVLAVDETTLDKVARLLPPLRALPAGDPHLLPGKLTAIFDLRRQLWRHVQHVPNAAQNEKHSMWSLLAQFSAGMLIVCAWGDFRFPWFDALSDQGVFFVTRLRQKTSYTVVHTFYQQEHVSDGLVWLGAHRADQAKHLVRLVCFRLGPVEYRYLTNVLDPQRFSLRQIAAVYQRRWDIELAFKLVKRQLGLHLLWGSGEQIVLLQVWGVLIISQILQALRQEIAVQAGVDMFAVSLPLLVEYAPRLAAQGQDPVAVFVVQGRALGFLRPATRTANRAPHVPRDQITRAPPALVTTRVPRYAGRRCPTQNGVPAYAAH